MFNKLNRSKIEKSYGIKSKEWSDIQTLLNTNFQDRGFQKDSSCLKFEIIKMIVYLMFEEQRKYYALRYNEAIAQIAYVHTFNTKKIYNSIRLGQFDLARKEIERILDIEESKVFAGFTDISVSAVKILLKYSNFFEYISENTDYPIFFDNMFSYAFLLTLEEIAWNTKIEYERMKGRDEEWIKEYLEFFEKEKERMKDFSFDITVCGLDFFTVETQKNFISIFNQYIKNWFSNSELKGKANIRFDIEDIEDNENKVDWSDFKELIRVHGKREQTLGEYVKDEHMEVFCRMVDIARAVYTRLKANFAESILDVLILDYINELSEAHKKEKIENEDSIRSLTALNKKLEREKRQDEREISNLIKGNNTLNEELKEIHRDYVSLSEFQRVKGELDNAKTRISELSDTLDKTGRKAEWQEGKIEDYQQQLEHLAEVEKELQALKKENEELQATLEKLEVLDEEDESIFEMKYNAVKDLSILFVGGKSNMLAKLKRYFPKSKYIDIDDGTNFNAVGNYDCAMIFTRVVSHSQAERVYSQMPKERVFYLNSCNFKLLVEYMYNLIFSSREEN